MKIRKSFAAVMTAIMLVGGIASSRVYPCGNMTIVANADDSVQGTYGDLTYVEANGTVTITKCDVNATYISVPETIGSSTVTKIDNSAFANCKKLVGVVVPDSVKNIGLNAFENCTGLTDVTLPETVTSISAYCFKGCTSLETLELPSTTTSIGYNAFEDCTALTTMILPSKLQTIGSSAFKNCTELKQAIIPDSVLSIGDSAYEGCTSLSGVTLGKSLKVLGGLAFANCTSLKSLYIPASVTSIGDGIIRNSLRMTSLNVDIDNKKFCTVDDVLYNADKTALISYPAGKKDYGYTVLNTTKQIKSHAFYGNMYLTEITFPNTLVTIGDYAFYSDEEKTNINKIFYYNSDDLSKHVSTDKDKLSSLDKLCDSYRYAYSPAIYEGNGSDGLVLFYYDENGAKNCTKEIKFSLDFTVLSNDGRDGKLYFAKGEGAIYGDYGKVFSLEGESRETSDARFLLDPYVNASVYPLRSHDTFDNIDLYKSNLDAKDYDHISSIKNSENMRSDKSFVFNENDLNYYYKKDDGIYVEFYYDDHGLLSKRTVNIDHPLLPKSCGKFNVVSDSNVLYFTSYLDTTANETDALEFENIKYHKHTSSIGICGADPTVKNLELPGTIDRLSVTAIEDTAFYKCSELESITISDRVESIGNHAFYFDSELEWISIPYSVSSIGDSAFEGCTDLKDVYYNGSEDEWKAITVGKDNECLLNANIHFNSNAPESIEGDVNADGKFTISDIVLLQKWILAVPDTKLANWKAADLCEDNRLDVFDLCLMKRMLVENS